MAVCSNVGKVSIRDFNSDDLARKVSTLKDPQEWCEIAKYSPDESMLAVGSHDTKIYIYQISEQGDYSLYATFNSHNSFLTALDWSEDGKYIRSCCGAYEKLYFNVADKEHCPHGVTETQNTIFASHEVKLGWDV